MKFSIIKFGIPVLASVLIFSACENDDPFAHVNDPELITTVQVHFTDSFAGTTQTFNWRDLDGPGGAIPVIDTIVLVANKMYTMTVDILDESKNPVDTITDEIKTENLAHIFLYRAIGNGFSFTQNYLDFDTQGSPLGLSSSFFTGDPSSGQLRIVLKHESDKAKVETTGETDLDVLFPAVFL